MDRRKLLFLCTGNYYRSRFAEELFNSLAASAAPQWRADSCALDIERGRYCNVGPISAHARRGLERRGLVLPTELRFPRQVCIEDLRTSSKVIALKEAEHRPLMARLFPDWADRIEYWHVHDLDQATADDALAEIDRAVRAVVTELEKG